jgi:hypothetical protein
MPVPSSGLPRITRPPMKCPFPYQIFIVLHVPQNILINSRRRRRRPRRHRRRPLSRGRPTRPRRRRTAVRHLGPDRY